MPLKYQQKLQSLHLTQQLSRAQVQQLSSYLQPREPQVKQTFCQINSMSVMYYILSNAHKETIFNIPDQRCGGQVLHYALQESLEATIRGSLNIENKFTKTSP